MSTQSATPTPVVNVTVRHLLPGDRLVSGAVIRRVWAGSKTPRGKRTVEMVSNGKSRTDHWNASTRVGVVNRAV